MAIRSSPDPYSSHQTVLLYAITHTQGPILELGIGWYSTPLLNNATSRRWQSGRQVFSYETDPDWHAQFSDFAGPDHKICLVESYEKVPISNYTWGLVFIDHTLERRARDLARVKDHASVVVIHDTEDPRYQIETVSGFYGSRLDYTKVRPWTSIFSNRVDVSAWCIP